jgi:hypothetical protein
MKSERQPLRRQPQPPPVIIPLSAAAPLLCSAGKYRNSVYRSAVHRRKRFTGGREDEAAQKNLSKKSHTRVEVMDSSKSAHLNVYFARLEDFEYVVGDGKLRTN